MRYNILFILFLAFLFSSCHNQEENRVVTISTSYGNLKVRLYDETPKHRDNFIKLAKQGFYNNLLIHRVNAGYNIESGAPDSRYASQNRQIGSDKGINHTIPAEIVHPRYFHKKGAIGAILPNMESNPDKTSSGSKFYIVIGTVYSNEQLDMLEMVENEKRFNRILDALFAQNQDSLSLFVDKDNKKFEKYQQRLIEEARTEYNKLPEFKYTEEQRKAYTTVGGTPLSDNNNTIFGEVIEGFDVLDKIGQAKVGMNNRPVQDIKITVK